jgi:hypothetical protein
MTSYTLHGREVRIPTTPASITPAADLAQGGYAALCAAHRRKGHGVTRPPELGEHESQLLQELGLADESSATPAEIHENLKET